MMVSEIICHTYYHKFLFYFVLYRNRKYLLAIGNRKCNPATWLSYDSSCCTAENPCGIGEGDCDEYNQCAGDLVCGVDNCGPEFPSNYDCCSKGN